MTTGKTIVLTRQTFVDKVMSLFFNMLFRLVITLLPRSKRLLISWLQSPSTVILEPRKIKSATASGIGKSPYLECRQNLCLVSNQKNKVIVMDCHSHGCAMLSHFSHVLLYVRQPARATRPFIGLYFASQLARNSHCWLRRPCQESKHMQRNACSLQEQTARICGPRSYHHTHTHTNCIVPKT